MRRQRQKAVLCPQSSASTSDTRGRDKRVFCVSVSGKAGPEHGVFPILPPCGLFPAMSPVSTRGMSIACKVRPVFKPVRSEGADENWRDI